MKPLNKRTDFRIRLLSLLFLLIAVSIWVIFTPITTDRWGKPLPTYFKTDWVHPDHREDWRKFQELEKQAYWFDVQEGKQE